MERFVEGEYRRHPLPLPASLDDYVTEDNLLRVVEALIGELDLGVLGFDGVEPAATGRPAYITLQSPSCALSRTSKQKIQ